MYNLQESGGGGYIFPLFPPLTKKPIHPKRKQHVKNLMYSQDQTFPHIKFVLWGPNGST